MSLVRIEIDPNVRVEGNNTFSGFSHINVNAEFYAVREGEPVLVYEPEADIEGFGWVYRMDYEKELVFIKVDWSSLR